MGVSVVFTFPVGISDIARRRGGVVVAVVVARGRVRESGAAGVGWWEQEQEKW